MSAILQTVNLNGSNGSHFFLRLYFESIAQTRNPKKSTVRLVLSVGSKDSYKGSGSTCNCYINGVHVGSFSSIPANSEIFVGNIDAEYTHTDDKELLSNYSASATIGWSGLSTTSLSGTVALPAIWDNTIVNANRALGYYKSTTWKLRRFYIKENGVWKPTKPVYKKDGSWYN